MLKFTACFEGEPSVTPSLRSETSGNKTPAYTSLRLFRKDFEMSERKELKQESEGSGVPPAI